jgi:hypothetical protein
VERPRFSFKRRRYQKHVCISDKQFEKLETLKTEAIAKYAVVLQTHIRSMIARRYYYVIQELQKEVMTRLSLLIYSSTKNKKINAKWKKRKEGREKR